LNSGFVLPRARIVPLPAFFSASGAWSKLARSAASYAHMRRTVSALLTQQ
jgi:hypothetical protein